jgi:hypothetical protein
MIGGFAFVAWPAEYGESGVMTFMWWQGRLSARPGCKTANAVKQLRLTIRTKMADLC